MLSSDTLNINSKLPSLILWRAEEVWWERNVYWCALICTSDIPFRCNFALDSLFTGLFAAGVVNASTHEATPSATRQHWQGMTGQLFWAINIIQAEPEGRLYVIPRAGRIIKTIFLNYSIAVISWSSNTADLNVHIQCELMHSKPLMDSPLITYWLIPICPQ